jgi:hypothetical protein
VSPKLPLALFQAAPISFHFPVSVSLTMKQNLGFCPGMMVSVVGMKERYSVGGYRQIVWGMSSG